MQQLLFRDWRFALLWAIGLTASVAAFFSDGGGHEQLSEQAEQIRAERAAAGQSASGALPPAEPAIEQDEAEPQFGDPVLDPNPLDPAVEPGSELNGGAGSSKAGGPAQPEQSASGQ